VPREGGPEGGEGGAEPVSVVMDLMGPRSVPGKRGREKEWEKERGGGRGGNRSEITQHPVGRVGGRKTPGEKRKEGEDFSTPTTYSYSHISIVQALCLVPFEGKGGGGEGGEREKRKEKKKEGKSPRVFQDSSFKTSIPYSMTKRLGTKREKLLREKKGGKGKPPPKLSPTP